MIFLPDVVTNGEKVTTLAVVSASTAKTMLVELNGEISIKTRN